MTDCRSRGSQQETWLQKLGKHSGHIRQDEATRTMASPMVPQMPKNVVYIKNQSEKLETEQKPSSRTTCLNVLRRGLFSEAIQDLDTINHFHKYTQVCMHSKLKKENDTSEQKNSITSPTYCQRLLGCSHGRTECAGKHW